MSAYQDAKDWFKQQQDDRNRRGLSSVYVQPTNASAYERATDWFSYQQDRRNNSYSTSNGSSTTSTTTYTPTYSTSYSSTVAVSDNVYSYNGGNLNISDYSEGQQIVFDASYEGAYVSGDSLNICTTSGTLTLNNIKNKLVDLRDSYGGVLGKAYMSGNAGTLDGRSLNGYEIIIGSAEGSNDIYAGAEGSTLWGNSGCISDNLIGGAGVDTFYVGKNDGSDKVSNASFTDRVDLYDVTMSDIVSASESGGTITFGFANGNTLSVQGNDGLSAKFSLADGSDYRYNRLAGCWQSA